MIKQTSQNTTENVALLTQLKQHSCWKMTVKNTNYSLKWHFNIWNHFKETLGSFHVMFMATKVGKLRQNITFPLHNQVFLCQDLTMTNG